MKRLVRPKPIKKAKRKKPKGYDKLSQQQKFIAAAKAAEVDETGEEFTRALARAIPPKRKPRH